MKAKIILIVGLVVLLLGSWVWMHPHRSVHVKTAKVVRVKRQSVIKAHGVVVPSDAQYLLAPMESTVVRFHRSFGDKVEVGDCLVEMQDEHLYQTFSDALVHYLKSKDHLAMANEKLKGEKVLLGEGVISEHEWMRHQSEQQTAYVDWLQSRIRLERLAKWMDMAIEDLESLSLFDQQAVEQYLRRPLSLCIRATQSGRFYAPLPKEGEKAVVLAEGARVKQGRSLGLVATGDRVEVHFGLSEEDMERVEPNLPVRIYAEKKGSNAWLIRVNQANEHQAAAHDNHALRMIASPRLVERAPHWVHIGMPVRGEIEMGEKMYKAVPLSAVFQKDHRHWVEVRRDGQWQAIAVHTEVLSADAVGLVGDVAVGDEVRLYD